MASHPRRRRLRENLSRYRDIRRSLRVPASPRSRRGLDWMNFFLADVQTGFGSFVAFYLSGLGWAPGRIGLALSVEGLAAVVAQIPGGALADAVRWKRAFAGVGIAAIAVAALLLAFVPSFAVVFGAQLLHGLTTGITVAAIAAISLGLVGRRAMSSRLGRNVRFSAAGSALTALALGALGTYFSVGMIFIAVAVLCVPALVALATIRGEEIDYGRARNATAGGEGGSARMRELERTRDILVFAGVFMLFQLADAAMLPSIGEVLALRKTRWDSLLVSGLIVIPQLIVTGLAPWVGYHSEKGGRKPLLLVGLGIETVRALLLMASADYPLLVAVQTLNGVSSAILNVLTALIITDLTTGSGRFNVVRGFVGTLGSVAAAVSTTAAGFIIQHFGRPAGFGFMAAAAAGACVLAWARLPETKPAKYID